MTKFKIALPIFLVLIYTGCMLLASYQVKESPLIAVSQSKFVNVQFNYQVLLLVITAFSLVTTYLLNKKSFLSYFSIGRITAPAGEMKLLGIKATDGWLKTGLSLSLIISLVTGVFMYFQLKEAHVDWSLLQSGIGWVLLFSLTNSFGEEMIFRMGIVSPLKGLLSPMTIYLISAILFGFPHLAGMPSGLIGATMAGFLGLVLAKSLHETNGFFWAWSIHFMQDVIIIGALFLLSIKAV